MLKTLRIFLLILILSQTVFSQKPGDNIFSGIQVHTIKLYFSQPNYWDSLTYYYNQGLEQYMMVNANIDGVTFDSIGVRLKGNSSYNHINNKKPFRLSIDQYRSDLKWDGIKGIHLNNCWEDPTLMREKIHLDFCSTIGIPAPRGNFAELYINDTLFAFYSMVEHVDKTFLNSRYGNKNGDMFKAVDGIGSLNYYSDFVYYGNDTSYYSQRYELKTDGSTTAWPRLLSLIDTLNNSQIPLTSIPQKINLSSVYKAFATDILLANFDSYINSCRNFYIYYLPTTNKFEWIVWDAGLSFGAFPNSGVTNSENTSITYVINATNRPLFGKILSIPTFKSAYIDSLRKIFSTYFKTSYFFPHIDSVANIIRPYVYNDQRKMYTNTQFETNIQNDVVVGANNRKPGLKSFLNSRITSVTNQLASLSVDETNSDIVPVEITLYQNYPNPFNPSTNIVFKADQSGYATINVYNMLGEKVSVLFDEKTLPGQIYNLNFNAENLPAGVYFYQLLTANTSITKQMILIK